MGFDKKRKSKLDKKDIILIIIVTGIILIDQIIKIIISNIGEVAIIPGILNFKISQNISAAYGIGSNSTIMYVLTNLVILGVIFKFIRTQNEYVDMKIKVFLSFILAGGISNVIDRVFRGYVLEFIDFKELINLPVFNIADLFILTGWICVAAIFAYFTVNEWKNKKTEKILEDQNDKKE